MTDQGIVFVDCGLSAGGSGPEGEVRRRGIEVMAGRVPVPDALRCAVLGETAAEPTRAPETKSDPEGAGS